MRVVDLSLPLENDGRFAPWWARNHVRRQDHRFGAWVVWWLFGLSSKYLRTGLGWANDVLILSTHGTTHVDAPWHYGPTCAGQPARTIDQMPLDWFYGPGLVLDVRDLDSQAVIGVDDLQRALQRLEHAPRAGDIVLIQTGNDRYWGRPEYFERGPGMSAAATHWLLDQGVRLAGIDSWGWDEPLRRQARRAKKTRDVTLFWEAHYVGVEREYCHMERLAQLDQLPPTGFTVCAFPLKVRGGSAGPARVVALVPTDEREGAGEPLANETNGLPTRTISEGRFG